MTVACDNGADYEGAALIGADGLWSPTRQAVIGDGAPRMAGHYVYRGVVPIEDIADKSRMNTMTIWGGPDLHMVQYRLQGGAVMNNVATICSRRIRSGAANPGAPDELEELFARTHPGVRENLRYVSRERNWVLHDRDPATNWTDGRVTLLGDAAHPTLQYLAQGAQMAIEDARGAGRKSRRRGRGLPPRLPRLPARAHEPQRARGAHVALLRRSTSTSTAARASCATNSRAAAIRTIPGKWTGFTKALK